MRATQTECYDIRHITILFYSSVAFCRLTPILTWNCLWQSTVQKSLLHLTQQRKWYTQLDFRVNLVM
jgi:hypothetical protein